MKNATYHPTIPPYEGNQEFHSIGWVPGVSYTARLRIFALHSMIPRQEQEEVFNEVPKAGFGDAPETTDKAPRSDGCCLEVKIKMVKSNNFVWKSFLFFIYWNLFDTSLIFLVRPIFYPWCSDSTSGCTVVFEGKKRPSGLPSLLRLSWIMLYVVVEALGQVLV